MSKQAKLTLTTPSLESTVSVQVPQTRSQHFVVPVVPLHNHHAGTFMRMTWTRYGP